MPNTYTKLDIDLDGFAGEISQLRKSIKQEAGTKELKHFRKIEALVWALTIIGFVTIWLEPNPFTIFVLAAASLGNASIMGHHIAHRSFDAIDGAPHRYNSNVFSSGYRKFFEWSDWIEMEAWKHEHNTLHHYSLGEDIDPDTPQDNAFWLRDLKLPFALKMIFVILGSFVFKSVYFGPTSLNELINKQTNTRHSFYSLELWSPFRPRFWQVVRKCWLPYLTFRFGLIPLLFLPLGTDAYENVLISLICVELLVNFWSFWVTVPTHAGTDIYAFDTPIKGKGEFYLRSIIGSANYTCGGFFNDYAHAYNNYQIEHHLFPDITPAQYPEAQRQVKIICKKYGVPYVQESVFKRAWGLMKILCGKETQSTFQGYTVTTVTP